jgi:hypothetical protein
MNWNLLVSPFMSRLWLKIGIFGQRPDVLQRNTRNIAITVFLGQTAASLDQAGTLPKSINHSLLGCGC